MLAPAGSVQSAATQVMLSPSTTTSPFSTLPSTVTMFPFNTCFVGSLPRSTVVVASAGLAEHRTADSVTAIVRSRTGVLSVVALMLA
jgi:hypothetical protein